MTEEITSRQCHKKKSGRKSIFICIGGTVNYVGKQASLRNVLTNVPGMYKWVSHSIY